jgi:F-type H+-transporting ATPase subunit epsilon
MSLTCLVVTPEATAVEQTADFVALPLYDGEIGIAAGHSPMIGRLGFGELRIRRGSTISRYYVDGGFVHVVNNVVSVLTNRAIAAERVDRDAAEAQLREAIGLRAPTNELLQARDRAQAQARGQLLVARRADSP